MPTPDDARLRAILQGSPTVAVLGIHDDLARPAGYVPAYLRDQGYRVLGVNPAKAGQVVCGHAVRASLAALRAHGERADDEPLDLVVVFRRPADLMGHLDDVLAARPRVVWLQQGIRSEPFAAALEAAGVEVVQDRCTLAEHRRLGLGAPRRA